MLEILLVLVVLAGVVLIVSAPLRRTGPEPPPQRADELAELEAARDAKYREIRDAELDHATGKLSTHDYQAIDTTLRAEAIGILHDLDQARETVADEEMPASD